MAAELEDCFSDPYPWEIDTLLNYCNLDKEILQKIGYGSGSLFASSLYIASQCSKLSLLGSSLEEQLEIREWVEFYCSKLRPPDHSLTTLKDHVNSCLEMLNHQLSHRVYLSNTLDLSVADLLFYYGLYRYMIEASFTSKMTYIHVSRWFDQIQHTVSVKPFTWQWVTFPKTN